MHVSENGQTYHLTPDPDAIIVTALRILEGRFRPGEALSTPQCAAKFATLRIGSSPREEFLVVFLDNRHRVLAAEVLFQGTIDGAPVYPREVVRRALELNAAAVVLAHNHPSGVLEPSSADRLLTQQLKQALGLVDVRVLDHLVVGPGGQKAISFAERGLL
jgi:DNA repair protein RadC